MVSETHVIRSAALRDCCNIKAVEKDLGKPKVRGNVVNVQVMQSNNGGAAEGPSMDRCGIRKVNNVRFEPPHDGRQLVVIPEIDAEGAAPYRRLMKVGVSRRYVATLRPAHPTDICGDHMNCGDTAAGKQASGEAGGMTCNSREMSV